MHKAEQLHTEAGFTLLEVLIALLILSIGMLGIAGMQMSSLKASQNTYHRSQATLLIYEIMDSISVNSGAVSAYNNADTVANDYAAVDCEGAACSTANIALYDLAQWEESLAAALPAGNGTIEVAGGLVTVTVGWDEYHNGATDCPSGAGEPDPETELVCVTESFRP